MNSSRGTRALVLSAAVSVVLTLSACGGSGEDGGEPQPSGDGSATAEKVKVYFTAGEQFDPVEKEIEGSAPAPEQATEALLEGPADATGEEGAAPDIDSAIPADVKLENLEIGDDGEAVVDLSEEFLGDIPADASKRSPRQHQAVNARLGQITYTLTQFEQVDSAKVRSGGVTVEPARDRADYSPPAEKPKVPKVRGASGAKQAGTRELQEKLASLGYLPASGVDGIAGYQTQQAVMAFQSWEGLDRDGVAGPATKAALSTAKRPKPKAKRPRRFMEVHLGKGVLLLVKDGRTKRAIHVSGGAPGYDTPTGRYRVFRKELQSWSYPYSVWLPYASYFNNGIAFHEYADIPPYPASHGCVRVPTPEAKRVYEFARMNTAVVVRS